MLSLLVLSLSLSLSLSPFSQGVRESVANFFDSYIDAKKDYLKKEQMNFPKNCTELLFVNECLFETYLALVPNDAIWQHWQKR